MTTPSEQQLEDTRKQMLDELLQTRQFKDQLTDKISGLQIQNSYNRLDYHKHIATIIVAVLGFATVMISQPDKVYFSYLLSSIIIFSTLLILILSGIRESLDHDANGLAAQHQEYIGILERKEGMLMKHMQSDNPNWATYVSEIENDSVIKDFANKADALEKNNKTQNKKMNYYGEMIIALFITGMFFIIAAFLKAVLPIYILILIIIFITIVSFLNLSQIITSLFNNLIHFAKSLNGKDKK